VADFATPTAIEELLGRDFAADCQALAVGVSDRLFASARERPRPDYRTMLETWKLVIRP